MKDFILEKGDSNIPLTKAYMLMEPTTDMESVEFWESRLEHLNQSYSVAYKTVKGINYYSVFTKRGTSGSKFKT